MNDREWLEEMWAMHAAKVYAYAARRVGAEAADDVVSDTFVVAWRNRDRRPDRDLPWLYGVARKVIADRRRSEDRRTRLGERIAAGTAPFVADDVDRLSALEALEHLSAADRETLMLSAWEGLDAGDAARVLGITTPSYRMRLSRARRRLARLMERGGSR